MNRKSRVKSTHDPSKDADKDLETVSANINLSKQHTLGARSYSTHVNDLIALKGHPSIPLPCSCTFQERSSSPEQSQCMSHKQSVFGFTYTALVLVDRRQKIPLDSLAVVLLIAAGSRGTPDLIYSVR